MSFLYLLYLNKQKSIMKIISIAFLAVCSLGYSQNYMTPEKLIELNRVGGMGVTEDEVVIYNVSKVDLAANKKNAQTLAVDLKGNKVFYKTMNGLLPDNHVSPDGKYRIVAEDVKIKKVFGTDYYPEMKESNMMIYNDLNYRHWDTWEDGKFSHLFIENIETGERTDIMPDEPYDCPQKPFGGGEDYTWSPDGKSVIYICKKKFGTEYAVSTNTDIYSYDLASGQTTNLTPENLGYDTQPSFYKDGRLAWTQMRRDGYESDKNDLVVMQDGVAHNLTGVWDGTINGFMWSKDGSKIYFTAPTNGTVQLFEIVVPPIGKNIRPMKVEPKQITDGQFDIRSIVGETEKMIVVGRGDMNHATELYTVAKKKGKMTQLTHENDALYESLELGCVKKRMTKTVDGKDLLSWVIYPPDFDSTKTYPTLLYCQGGPQGALSQFYSYRWNFQLMAAHGYIIIAPNRRGMPGYGVEWNEQISKDYGGLNMQDYLSAIDDLSTESYVDKERLGCIGASYGGYSAFYLAAIHEGRFKTFVAHDGIFNWKSMYGTTEELFFVNWDLGGAYWDKENEVAQKSHNAFNPAERVEDWTSPILIIQGGMDFRVPIGQGLEAFQAAQLQGINSRLLFFPEENHWVLDYQNSFIWHSEFYKWLEETL